MLANMSGWAAVPVRCLGRSARRTLRALDAPRVLPAAGGAARDWRGLAAAALPPTHGPSPHDTATVLAAWQQAPLEEANLQLLVDYLEAIDRFDVLQDVEPYIEADAQKYLRGDFQSEDNDLLYSNNDEPIIDEENYLTMHDVQLSQRGGNDVQMYDAFVLYADEDFEFVRELIDKMEGYGIKLCIKDDLLGGHSSERSAIVQLISKRCRTLVVILSPEFAISPANKFIIDFAQDLGIKNNQRKVVPCIYKPCKIPEILSCYFALDYRRTIRWNFWEKFRDSLAPSKLLNTQSSTTYENLSNASTVRITDQKQILPSKPNKSNMKSPELTRIADVKAKNEETNKEKLSDESFLNLLNDLPDCKDSPLDKNCNKGDIEENKLNKKIDAKKKKKNLYSKIRKILVKS